MNRYTRSICIACILSLPAVTWIAQSRAQTDPNDAAATKVPSCIGVVDFVRIFNECQQIKDLNEALRKLEVEVQTEAKQRQEVIDEKRVQVDAFQPGTPDYQQRRKDLIRLGIEANVWLKTAEQDLEGQKFDWTRIIYEKAAAAAADISRERGFSLILQYKAFTPDDTDQTLATIRRMIQERAVVYADKTVDITDEVIVRLNEAHKAAGGKKQLEGVGKMPRP